MPNPSTKGDIEGINDDVRAIWDQNADFWDGRMGEGNAFHREIVSPATEHLLGLRQDETVLEIACGNGQLARRLATLGARVVACDFSERFIERARARTAEQPELADRIEYRVVDATDERQLLAIGERQFDAVVCGMALMDMAAIDPLMHAVPRLLQPAGRFVFTIMHPCFNHSGSLLSMEEEDQDGELVVTSGVKVVSYLSHEPRKGLGMIGQPAPHYYFHRPLSVLLGAAFAAGLVLDGLEEPAFTNRDPSRAFSWANLLEIPPALAARLRPWPSPVSASGS